MKLTRYLLGICLLVFSIQGSAFDEMDMKRFKALNKCPDCDLSGADLSGRRMEKANLKGANLKDVIAYATRFDNADLSGAVLTNAILGTLYLSACLHTVSD